MICGDKNINISRSCFILDIGPTHKGCNFYNINKDRATSDTYCLVTTIDWNLLFLTYKEILSNIQMLQLREKFD